MTIANALAKSFEASKKAWKPLLILYAVNLVLSVILALEFRAALLHSFDDSMAQQLLMNGFDFTTFQDFMTVHGDALTAIFSGVVWSSLFYLILNVFLAGGILGYFRGPGGSSTVQTFFSDSVRFFSRFLRLFLLFFLVTIVVLVLAFVILGIILEGATGNADSEVTVFVWNIGAGVILLVIFGTLLLMNDFAKVNILHTDTRSIVQTAARAAGFVMKSFPSVFGLGVLIAFLLALATGMYWWLGSEIGMNSGIAVLVMVVIQQVYVLFRLWMRIFLYGAEVELGSARFGGEAASRDVPAQPATRA